MEKFLPGKNYQVALLAFVTSLSTRWSHLYCHIDKFLKFGNHWYT